jgi:tetratricopeptide (TPR) repeat protein
MADPSAIERIDNLRVIGRSSDAERMIRTALAEEPQDGQLLWRLAAVLLNSKRYDEGLAAAQAAVAADPSNPNAHRVLGLLLAETGAGSQAVHAAYTAVTLAPHHAHTVVAYSYVLSRANRYEEAAEVARRAVELAPHDTDAHTQVGDIAMHTGDHEAARRAYEEVLRLDPEHAAARRALAGVDHVSRRQRKALHGLVAAGRMDPNLEDLLPLVAAVLWQLNWQMRIGYFVALFPVRSVITKGHPGPSEIRTVGVVMVVLAVAAVWWHFRGLPRGSATVLRAALRQDRFLTLTYLVMALTLVVYAVMAVTGWAAVAALIVPLAVVLGLLIIGKAIGDAIKGR